MLRGLASTSGLAAAAAAASSLRRAGIFSDDSAECAPYQGPKQTKVRTQDYPLVTHHHGKAKVRVLKVRHDTSAGREKHSVSEYMVHTRLYSPEYAKVFTNDDNADLVATDTQKNTVYIVAKRTDATSPEQFGVDIAKHFMDNYPILTACQIDVEETLWERVVASDGDPHDHAFVKKAPEQSCATVQLARGAPHPKVTSSVKGMVILKTTQSGFSGYHKDNYTLLPDTEDRCLATELSADWSYNSKFVDYVAARAAVKKELVKGLFGPAKGGVFSASLQATIYDAGSLCLAAVPELTRIAISTPNLHYLPTTQLLKAVGVASKDTTYVRDVFVPTSEPSGTIYCEVAREATR